MPLQPNSLASTYSLTAPGTPIVVRWCLTLSLAWSMQYKLLELGNATLAAFTNARSSSEPTSPLHINSLACTTEPLIAALTVVKKKLQICAKFSISVEHYWLYENGCLLCCFPHNFFVLVHHHGHKQRALIKCLSTPGTVPEEGVKSREHEQSNHKLGNSVL